MIKLLWNKYKSIIAYLFWGGVTTLINIGVFMAWLSLGGNYQLGTIIAWIITVLVAYFSNKVWVFGSKYSGLANTLREMGSFFSFRLVTLGMELVITWFGISVLSWAPLLVKVLDNVIVVIANYIFSKLIIFNKFEKNKDKR